MAVSGAGTSGAGGDGAEMSPAGKEALARAHAERASKARAGSSSSRSVREDSGKRAMGSAHAAWDSNDMLKFVDSSIGRNKAEETPEERMKRRKASLTAADDDEDRQGRKSRPARGHGGKANKKLAARVLDGEEDSPDDEGPVEPSPTARPKSPAVRSAVFGRDVISSEPGPSSDHGPGEGDVVHF